MTCSDCTKGCLHDGTPVGAMETIAGVDTYVSLPPAGTYLKDTAVIFLGDVFGLYNNAKLLCDSFAQNGFATYFPDYLHGDAIPLGAMHSETGVSKIGVTGYCFGGKYVTDLLIENAVTAGVAAHPAGIVVPDDLQSILDKSKGALLINACETDKTWPKENQDIAAKILGGYAPGWQQNYYPGCTHGFATRADLAVPEQKFGKEDAFKESVEWFKKYLV